MPAKIREQEIAVFGESGSGKTVLLSSFYGAAQEPSFRAENPYQMLADDTTQGHVLRQNYLRMREEAQAPAFTRFAAKRYSFTLKPKEGNGAGGAQPAQASPFSALRLIWHDYPGEWFTEEPGTDEEAKRRIETFRTLLKSDAALILIDGQKLLDYGGEEDKYLKSLFWGMREGLERLKDAILDDEGPLAQFPRVWVVALSKADLHPDMDAQRFQDLIIQKAAGDLAALHDTIKGFVKVPEALSLGEDFLLLSSARFEPGRIEVTKRVGLDLILPVATILPLERVAQWTRRFKAPLKMLGTVATHAEDIGRMLTTTGAPFAAKLLAKIPVAGKFLAPIAVPVAEVAADLGTEKIKQLHADALAHKDYLTATVSLFRLDLERGVADHVLVKSPW